MRYLLCLIFLACTAPTDNRIDPPSSVDEIRVVHPRIVTMAVTPVQETVYPGGTVQYVAVLRDGQGRTLRASRWVWSTSDTTIAVVSQTGLATGLKVGNVVINVKAYPPWLR